ncbi:beta-phosphoglucomutase [Galbibacter pacificus]|uniref:Beta-phosphoglucomutase n=1 Tax=Galbibacter pacificus TaxID=2996052 RepID=A0ABT6FWB6_9FLAO|nr:beta-phosphoglucomutase [Galbibacter pacificus]MDG3583999.1 beta-phosphoglucomutase [Galbibacter pacificus]MDG3587564.1 beta-phosphoglucomutase [Galbibacter pacificus]
MKKEKGFIFDLDGVIVDTAKFHFLAWKKAAAEFNFELTPELNEKLKGVSRIDSLNKILKWANASVTNEKFAELSSDKNEDYLSYVQKMTKKDILPGVYNVLSNLKEDNYPMALGSASKNASTILEKVGLLDMFDSIVDGNSVRKAKPDPEVFLIAAKNLKIPPKKCIVFEDSEAGITAANNAGMISVGIGNKKHLGHADYMFDNFNEITFDFLKQLQPK